MINLKALKFQRKYKSFFDNISFLEDIIIGNKEKDYINFNNKSIFVLGMPRSGTTILTHVLAKFKDVASYVYSDLPFTKTLFFWKFFKRIYYFKNKSIERVHGDGLIIDTESPDSFEELIWAENLDLYKNEGFFKILDEDYSNDILKRELLRNINKLLIVKKKNIYLSKGNYNLFRIKYIQSIIKNSFFLICIRNPQDVVNSSVNTHEKFLNISLNNISFSEEMSELCHFEFGKNRRRTSLIKHDNDFDYYLNQWIEIHELIKLKYLNHKNVFLINYDNFVHDPYKVITIIQKKLNIEPPENIKDILDEKIFKKISKKRYDLKNLKSKNIYTSLIEKCIN